jgi:molecular chaperone Hsp33
MVKQTVDYLIRGMIDDLNVRFMLADTSNTVETGIKIHDTDPVASFVFARSLTVAALTAPLLEENEKYSLRWQYDGIIGTVLADVDANCHLRGIPSGACLMDAEDVIALYGENGVISVMKSSDGRILNSGQAPAGMLDVVDDIAFFFSTSDQIETEIKAVVGFNADPTHPVALSSGFMIQALPDCDLLEFDKMRLRMRSDDFSAVLSSKSIAEEVKLKQIIKSLTDGEIDSPKFEFANQPIFQCSCDVEKMKTALKTLPQNELNEIFAKNEKPEIKCHFCLRTYSFTNDELK